MVSRFIRFQQTHANQTWGGAWGAGKFEKSLLNLRRGHNKVSYVSYASYISYMNHMYHVYAIYDRVSEEEILPTN